MNPKRRRLIAHKAMRLVLGLMGVGGKEQKFRPSPSSKIFATLVRLSRILLPIVMMKQWKGIPKC
jgi:hypothetical protein